MCSLMMIDSSKHVGAFKCFNVCFRIIQYTLVNLLVLIISDYYTRVSRAGGSDHFILFLPHRTLSYVDPHNDSIPRMETLRSPDFEIYFARQ
jgi:hypothetical protein